MSAVVSQVPDSKAPGASTIEVERAVWHPGHPPIDQMLKFARDSEGTKKAVDFELANLEGNFLAFQLELEKQSKSHN